LNKDEVIIEDQRIFERIKDRHNVILLGDGEGDIGMVQNIKYDNIIKIGYLNEKEEELKEKFLEIFDVVITNDGSFEYINKLLKNILNF
jgi:5'-nucleotidase